MMIVADNLRITNPAIEKAINSLEPDLIQEVVQRCEAAGADAIDINPGPLHRDPEGKMRFLVETIQEVSSLPLLIDTTNSRAIEAGLRAGRNRVIINGFSLEPAKMKFILPLAEKYQTEIIGYLLYSNGHVPPNAGERLRIAVELFSAVKGTGISKDRLIIDPIVAPLMWDDGNVQNMEILSVLRTLPDLLGFDIRTVGGLSNLTAGRVERRKRLLLESAYLPMLLHAGLDMVLMDMFHEETVRVAVACRALMGRKVFSFEEIP